MPEDPARRRGPANGGLAALGITALAVGCCAGLPLVAALAGSVAAGTLLGVGGGIVVAVVLGALIVVRVRTRRRACEPRPQHPASPLPRHH